MEYGKKFHNCLRVQITPDAQSGDRIRDLVSHCLQYGFDNVMLMINVEDFNRGHITREAAKEWVAVLKAAKAALEDAGISVSLNNWIEMGHADRGMKPYPGQNFGYLTDMNGRTINFQLEFRSPEYSRNINGRTGLQGDRIESENARNLDHRPILGDYIVGFDITDIEHNLFRWKLLHEGRIYPNIQRLCFFIPAHFQK